jgi:HSP20 family protein
VNVIRDELDRIFTRFASELHSLLATNGTAWKWSFDITDEDEAIVVRAEAPGFEAKDFDIQLEDTRLVLRANKTHTKEEAGKKSEVTDVACYESIDLPATIDKDKIEARYHNGVLTITLPKTADAKARRIKVKAE